MSQGENKMGLRDILNNPDTASHAGEITAASIATKWGMGGGTATSLFGFITSNGAAVLIGIVITIAGFLLNYWFQRRREKREIAQMHFTQDLARAEERRKEEFHRAQLEALKIRCEL